MTDDIPEASKAWFEEARPERRFVCTPEHPWMPELQELPGPKFMVLHPDAKPTDYVEVDVGTGRFFHVERYCPNCKYEWKQELP